MKEHLYVEYYLGDIGENQNVAISIIIYSDSTAFSGEHSCIAVRLFLRLTTRHQAPTGQEPFPVEKPFLSILPPGLLRIAISITSPTY